MHSNLNQFRSHEIRRTDLCLVEKPLSDHFLSEIEEQELKTAPLYELFMDDSDDIISQFNPQEISHLPEHKVQIQIHMP
jgi:hypothetical protein